MRLCLHGGAGIGKSLLAAHLYEKLRREGYGIELVQEAIKPMAYAGRVPGHWENLDVFHEQLRRERAWINAGVPHLVTDSPVLTQCFYMNLYGVPEADGCLRLAHAWERDHPATHVVLRRMAQIPYEQAGRYQSRPEAEQIDRDMVAFLSREGVATTAFDATDRFGILEHVRRQLHARTDAA